MDVVLKRRSWWKYQIRRPVLLYKTYRLLRSKNNNRLDCLSAPWALTRYIPLSAEKV
jgi:hypothetical protein